VQKESYKVCRTEYGKQLSNRDIACRAEPGSGKCACGMSTSCAKPELPHNCVPMTKNGVKTRHICQPNNSGLETLRRGMRRATKYYGIT